MASTSKNVTLNTSCQKCVPFYFTWQNSCKSVLRSTLVWWQLLVPGKLCISQVRHHLDKRRNHWRRTSLHKMVLKPGSSGMLCWRSVLMLSSGNFVQRCWLLEIDKYIFSELGWAANSWLLLYGSSTEFNTFSLLNWYFQISNFDSNLCLGVE